MIFIASGFIFVMLSILFLKKAGIRYPISTGVALAVGLSLLAVMGLAENYTHSLIPEVNDGIGISNDAAYWILGEDAWSVELFKIAYKQSIHITLVLLGIYPLSLIMESRFASKDKNS